MFWKIFHHLLFTNKTPICRVDCLTGIALHYIVGSNMGDQSRTRRRHQPSSKVPSAERGRERYRTEIRSGGSTSDAEEEDGHEDGHNDPHRHTQKQKEIPKSRTKKRRRRRRRDDNPPFLILFFQVGAVLMMLCLASFHVYKYAFPSSLVGTNGGDDEYYYVGDTADDAVGAVDQSVDGNAGYASDSSYRHEQELKLKELLHSTDDDEDKDETKPPKKIDASTRDRKEISEAKTEIPMNKSMPPLPTFNLSKSAEWDAFGIFEKVKKHNNNNDNRNNPNPNDGQSFWRVAQSMRTRFAGLYGGENAARMLLDRGMTTFPSIIGAANGTETTETPPSDVVATACRLHHAKAENRAFRMAFGGYSVTTGRGNKHKDSYPFQLQELLEPILKAAGFAFPSPLSVTNAAIGGVPSFPYGWCMNEFWGGGKGTKTDAGADTDTTNGIPDVVSWDFGMNEASGGPEGLEAYVRHLLSTYSTSIPPKLIVKDYFTASHRKEVLAEYSSILKDPVVVHTDHAVEPIFDATKVAASGKGTNSDDDGDEEYRRPPGFRKWREWGAPRGAPGQAVHHPAVQEHKLSGWILAMHFVTALEYMVVMEEEEDTTESSSSSRHWCPTTPLQQEGYTESSPFFSLPPPVSRKIVNDTNLPYDGIFFGHPMGAENDNESQQGPSSQTWRINPMRCRTTFEPKFSGDLSEIVVSGTMGEDLDPTLPKSQYYYNQGWTYDLSEAEKGAKRKLNLYPDGLGFKDSKEAYYGIYESPPITLLLPYESDTTMLDASSSLSSSLLPQAGDSAEDWYESIVLCQVNNKNTFDSAFADPSSCNFGNDVGIKIGGINVAQNTTKMLNTIGSVYLGKPICKHVAIPPRARLTSHNTLLREGDSGGGGRDSSGVMAGDSNPIDSRLLDTDQTGLLVEVFVSNPHVVHINQACSLSHVVWEERLARPRPRADKTIQAAVKKDRGPQ
jgi:hypothetical protein